MYKNFRYEFKYVLDSGVAAAIEAYLEKIGLKKDDAAENGLYVVTSLYFDTPTLEDYYDKLSGIKYRKKLRGRVHHNNFVADKKVWLEIKEKHDMNINKMRESISYDDWMRLVQTGSTFDIGNKHRGNKTIQKFLYLFHRKNYRPHAIVRYSRKAFIDNFLSGIRVTLDSNLETCAWEVFMDNEAMDAMYPGKVVLEVKFSKAMPWWFGDMVKRFQLSRQAFSKYTHAVDVLNKHNSIAR
ncbi:MAG: polyphosphate polymerase domain-containing protein [Parcubacteria group bacterium]|nr:polyphosphate polymerase domain-containing protein [Parcubacteria group bacterium]